MSRRRPPRRVNVLAAVLVVVGGAVAGCGGDEPPPRFDAVDLDSGAAVSSSDLHGGAMLYAAWATWCVPCERELPALEAALPALEAAGIDVVAVNVDGSGAALDDMTAMIDRLAPSLTSWRDREGVMLVAYESFLMPFSVLVDERGAVAQTWNGSFDPAELFAESF